MENTGSGGKHGVWKTRGLVENTGSQWKTRGLVANTGSDGKRGVSVENTCHLIGDSNEYKFIYVPSTISSEIFF